MEEAPEGGPAAASSSVYNVYKDSTHDGRRIHVGDNNIIHNHNPPEDRLRSSKRAQDRLEEYVSRGAAHDSAERGTDAPKCFPETREAVQGEMMSFVDPGGEEQVLWLSGPAGAGKTAIVGSICDQCQAMGWLAGSFYFSAAANKVERCSSRYLIPTLAFHFFQLDIPGLPAAILTSIDANPSVFDKRLDQQVEILLLKPLRQVVHTKDQSKWPKVVVVDGVDECGEDQGRTYSTNDERRRSREDNHREVLSALSQAANDPAFPFRIVIASRPKRAIEQYFSSQDKRSFKRVFLDEKYTPEADIELFCRAMLSKMGLDWGLGVRWFDEVGKIHEIDNVPLHLAEKSSGQFVYAATAIRFVQDDSGPPNKQLERVLDWRGADKSKPFAALDALYTGILQTSVEPHRAALWIVAPEWFPMSGGPRIHAFLQSVEGEIGQLFGRLSSLVRIVDDGGNPDFHVYHLSLTDFLEDPGRSGDLYVQIDQIDGFLYDRAYKILRDRGPQVSILHHSSMNGFLAEFCQIFPNAFSQPQKHRYTPDDVGWWISHVDPQLLPERLNAAYFRIHLNCPWYNCRSACKVWRKGILRHAKANGWRVPTTLEKLQDRLKPLPAQEIAGDSRRISIKDILHPPGGWPRHSDADMSDPPGRFEEEPEGY